MTPLPKKKHTRGRSNRRKNSATHKLKLGNLSKCPSCGKLKENHRACPHCGFYK